jgi:hypothetical protein
MSVTLVADEDQVFEVVGATLPNGSDVVDAEFLLVAALLASVVVSSSHLGAELLPA